MAHIPNFSISDNFICSYYYNYSRDSLVSNNLFRRFYCYINYILSAYFIIDCTDCFFFSGSYNRVDKLCSLFIFSSVLELLMNVPLNLFMSDPQMRYSFVKLDLIRKLHVKNGEKI